MRQITAYLSADGVFHVDEKSAIARDEDLLGQELEGLLRLFNLDITRNQEYKALLHAMKNRAAFTSAIREVLQIIEHGEGGDTEG